MTREHSTAATAKEGLEKSRGRKCRGGGGASSTCTPHVFSFGTIVDVIYGLPLEERLDLRNLLDRNITETRRAEMLRNGQEAQRAEKNKELVFSDNIGVLRKMLLS
jgi:hypothetical protein